MAARPLGNMFLGHSRRCWGMTPRRDAVIPGNGAPTGSLWGRQEPSVLAGLTSTLSLAASPTLAVP